jgi:hypothetical protein
MPKKKTTSPSKGAPAGSSKTNKSAFVRSLPTDTPAKEVIEKGKAQGIKLTAAYVYSIRTAAKAHAAKPGRAAGLGRSSGAAKGRDSNDRRIEDLLRAVAAELGLSRAIGLLQAEQQRVRAVLGE